jgi:hypothetical protein
MVDWQDCPSQTAPQFDLWHKHFSVSNPACFFWTNSFKCCNVVQYCYTMAQEQEGECQVRPKMQSTTPSLHTAQSSTSLLQCVSIHCINADFSITAVMNTSITAMEGHQTFLYTSVQVCDTD